MDVYIVVNMFSKHCNLAVAVNKHSNRRTHTYTQRQIGYIRWSDEWLSAAGVFR